MSQIFNIQDDKVIISKLAVSNIEGEVTHEGHLTLVGSADIAHNLTVKGTLSADVFHVKNLITENGGLAGVGDWTYNTEEELNGKGFNWTWGAGNVRLAYRTGQRLWTNADIDVEAGHSYKIDNTVVLSTKELGNSIIKSNLREVGPLKSLRVLGDTILSDFVTFNSTLNRIGVNTDEPSLAVTILENNVEFGFGSPAQGIATFGTQSNHDVGLATDGAVRLTVKNNGEVHIGDEVGKAGVLRVFGTLHAEAVITDTRIDRTSPLEFKADRDSSIYGKGLIWTGNGATRQLVMRAGPDRLWSSESIEVSENQCYYVGGQSVLTQTALGQSVTSSSLTSLGELQSLTVHGTATFYSTIEAGSATINAKSIAFNNGVDSLNINNTSINTDNNISVTVRNADVFYADTNEIVLGNTAQSRRPVKVFGPVAIGINNPDPDVSLSVNGNVSFANKKFMNGIEAPTTGSYSKGDIVWNQDPKVNSYIGWVCVVDGAPGQWLPFGAIGRQ